MDDQEYRPEIEDVMEKAEWAPEPATDKLTLALAKAQSEMSNPKLDSENPHYRSKYSSLAATRDAIIPALSKNGIALSFTTEIREGGVALIGRLMHSSGQALEAEWPITIGKPQDMASQMTYGKRQLAQALAFVSGDQDDDANAAQDAAVSQQKTVSGRPTPDAVAAKQRQAKADAPPKEPWHGPLKVTELKSNMRALMTGIAEAQTEGEVEALWFGDEYHAVLEQAQKDLGDWYERAQAKVNETLNKMLEGSDA